MRTEGKAEIIDGRVVTFMPSGVTPSLVAVEILVRLREYARSTGVGVAFGDGIGYAPDPAPVAGRRTFVPDASYYAGPLPADRMRFVTGVPDLAIEVRSEGDTGPAAERDMADKRAQYLAAGTREVWDVDPEAGTVTAYRPDASPRASGPGHVLAAGPAAPGFAVAVADVFG